MLIFHIILLIQLSKLVCEDLFRQYRCGLYELPYLHIDEEKDFKKKNLKMKYHSVSKHHADLSAAV